MNLFNGVGWFYYDISLTALICFAGLTQFWSVFFQPDSNKYFKIGKALAGFGWVLWGTRFALELLNGGDPLIALPGLIAITFISCGTILFSVLGKVK